MVRQIAAPLHPPVVHSDHLGLGYIDVFLDLSVVTTRGRDGRRSVRVGQHRYRRIVHPADDGEGAVRAGLLNVVAALHFIGLARGRQAHVLLHAVLLKSASPLDLPPSQLLKEAG